MLCLGRAWGRRRSYKVVSWEVPYKFHGVISRRGYRPGFNFAKAGVMLLDPQDCGIVQGELDLEPEPQSRGELMGALNRLNDRYGRGTVTLASAGVKKVHCGILKLGRAF